MDTKVLTAHLELKADAPEGTVVAVIATLDVIDKDADITRAGAFEGSPPVKMSLYNHSSAWQSHVPVGAGRIVEKGDQAIFEGLINLGIEDGRKARDVLKFNQEQGAPDEWSYAFNVIEAASEVIDEQPVRVLLKLAPFEVSPVMRGAGEGTQTVAVKTNGTKFIDQTVTVQAAVDDYVKRVESLATLRAQDGRPLSSAKRDGLKALADSLRRALKTLDDLATDPEIAQMPSEVMAYQRLRARMIGARIATR